MKVRLKVLNSKPENYQGPRLSVSKVKAFDKCPSAFRYRYIERFPKKIWAHSIFGSFAHEVLEEFDQQRLNGNMISDHELMTLSFNNTLAKTEKELRKKGKKDFLNQEAKEESFGIFNNYLEKIALERKENRSPKTIGVEVPFYIEINDEILVWGFIDKEQIDPDGMYHVKDYKTSKSKQYRKYHKKDMFQLETYAFVKFIQNPELKKIRGSYEFLRFDFDVVEKVFNRDKTVDKISKKFIDYADKIKNEKLFRPEPSKLCKYCDFLEFCKTGRDFMEEDEGIMMKHGMIDW